MRAGDVARLERGTKVTVRAYGGALLRRRVWEDVGRGVMVTNEREYQCALQDGEEALASGFPKSDIVDIDE